MTIRKVGITAWRHRVLSVSLIAIVGAGCFAKPVPTATPVPLPRVVNLVSVPEPSSILFDGEQIWVSSSRDGTVTRLRRDGGVLGVHLVGKEPVALAYGGGYVWVADRADSTVTKLTLDGAVAERIAVGRAPSAMAYWAGVLWVANAGDDTVTRIGPGDVTPEVIPVGRHPAALAPGQDRLWVANRGDSTVAGLDVDGNVTRSFRVVNGPSPAMPGTEDRGPGAIVVEAGQTWLGFDRAGGLSRLDGEGRPTWYSAATEPSAMIAADNSLWVADSKERTVTRFDSTGTRLFTVPVGQKPVALAYDGRSIWVADRQADAVMRLDP